MLAKSGVGLHKKKAKVISEAQENILWEMGLLGSDTPESPLNTLVYLFGIHFAMRA